MAVDRSQRGFLLIAGSSVVILSFVYGISVGLKRPRHWANARPDTFEAPLDQSAEAALLSELGLPAEIELTRLGRNAALNDRPATIVSFTTEIAPHRLLQEQKQFWEASGFRVMDTAGQHRGVLVGFDPASGRKLLFSVWTIPPKIRGVLSQGKPVQGMLSLLEGDKENSGLEVQFVPDVPVIPGGRGGAVFRSDDIQGKTYSSVYTNPGSLSENLDFYRREMGSDGWREGAGALTEGKTSSAHLAFRRGVEEIVLLFSPKPGSGTGEQTVVAVFRGPKLEIQSRVF